MKKIINEQEIVSSTSISEYLDAIQKALIDETEAIQFYDEMLKLGNLPASARQVLEEIRDDEKDHLALLTALLTDEMEEEMPYPPEEEGLPIEIEGESEESEE